MHGHTYRRFLGGLVAAGHAAAGDAWAARCFADEVVVDFPSVAPALDRMRSAFLAEDGQAPFSADVRLTFRDAVAGVTLPLRVPIRCTCRGCGGRGESWTESCVRCEGSGAELLDCELRVRVPAGVTNGARVQFTLVPPQSPPTRVELCIAID